MSGAVTPVMQMNTVFSKIFFLLIAPKFTCQKAFKELLKSKISRSEPINSFEEDSSRNSASNVGPQVDQLEYVENRGYSMETNLALHTLNPDVDDWTYRGQRPSNDGNISLLFHTSTRSAIEDENSDWLNLGSHSMENYIETHSSSSKSIQCDKIKFPNLGFTEALMIEDMPNSIPITYGKYHQDKNFRHPVAEMIAGNYDVGAQSNWSQKSSLHSQNPLIPTAHPTGPIYSKLSCSTQTNAFGYHDLGPWNSRQHKIVSS